MNSFDTTLEDPSCASPVEVRFFARRRDEGGVGAILEMPQDDVMEAYALAATVSSAASGICSCVLSRLATQALHATVGWGLAVGD